MSKLAPVAAALVLLSAGTAQATTFANLSATPNPATLSGASVTVNYHADLGHADGVPGSCGLQLDYGDGSAPEQFLVQVANTAVDRPHAYTKAGSYTASLKGVSMLNPTGTMRPACSGGPVSTQVQVQTPVPVATLESMEISPNTVVLSDGKAKIRIIVKQNVPPGAVKCLANLTDTSGASYPGGISPDQPAFSLLIDVTKPGTHTLTLNGVNKGNTPACKGSVSANVTVIQPLSDLKSPVVVDQASTMPVMSIGKLEIVKNNPRGPLVDQPLSVEVGSDGLIYGAGKCGYVVTAENLEKHTKASKTLTTFGTHEIFTPQMETTYRISAEGVKVGDIPACKGHATRDTTTINDRAWIADFQMKGFSTNNYRGEWVETQWYLTTLTIKDGKPCSYEVKWKIGGESKSFPLLPASGGAIKIPDYQSGKEEIQVYWAFKKQDVSNSFKVNLPNTATVTIQGSGPLACNGKVSKSLTLPFLPYNPYQNGPTVTTP